MFRFSIGMIIAEAMLEYNLIEAEGGGLLTSLLGATAIFIMLGGNLSDRIGKYIAMSIGFTISARATLLIFLYTFQSICLNRQKRRSKI
jgi:MFS family permease